MKIMSTLAAEGTYGASLASPSFVKHRGRLFSSHLSIGSRISALPTPPPRLLLRGNRRQPPASEPPLADERRNRTFLVDAFHQRRSLKALLDELSRSDSFPLQILARDGDWPFEKLRVVIAFLADTGRITEALQVFDQWKSMETSRASAMNYSKIIRLLCEKDLIDKAMLIFEEMEKLGFTPSVAIYNAVIHGFARIKEFNKSKALLCKMVEDGLPPIPETYNGLLQAYGSYGFYDEMSKCAKAMESAPCTPNEITYNILIQEFSRGRLIEKMEKFYRILLSKRMNLQICTLIAMLEAYSDLGILEKMEKMYAKVLNANAYIKDRLVRKMANVYIQHCRFARLDEFGNEIGVKNGRTELVWCILLLSAVGLSSKRGINSIKQEMVRAKVRLSTTFTSIFALFYLKMRDFKALNAVFSEAMKQRVEPDIIMVGILFDACSVGYNCKYVLEKWRRSGWLEETAEMRTDPLVMAAFGKGSFMLKCEEVYTFLGSKAKEKKIWKYDDLIKLFFV